MKSDWSKKWMLTVGLVGLALWVGCRPSQQAETTAQDSSDNQKTYHVQGVIQEVLADRKKLKIQHEEIPDYMDAMTMTFDVRNQNSLEQFQPGDAVEFDMVVTEREGWIEKVVKTGETNLPVQPTFRIAREVEPLEVGDFMPDYPLTNQFGRPVTFSDFKGQAVAFTFLYTRCPFPNFCPRMAGNFAATMQKLKTMPNAPTNWHLLTITFDPDFDTPAVLKAYGEGFGYDPKSWSLLTGNLIDLTAAAEHFGMMFWRSDPTKPASIDHNLRTVVLDVAGRVHNILPENEWTADQLAEAIIQAAGQPAEADSPAPATGSSP